jgi:hypothetical protein
MYGNHYITSKDCVKYLFFDRFNYFERRREFFGYLWTTEFVIRIEFSIKIEKDIIDLT